MSFSFYKSIQPFSDFNELTVNRHYHLVPQSWHVIITDIKGSTQAVAEGRYKDVNMLGASSIMALINTFKDFEIPFVFGGDGATLLIPAEAVAKTRPLFEGLKYMANKDFQLELRIGIVPVQDLIAAGGKIEVAKYAVAPGNNIALFRSGGLALAESWIKNGGPNGKNYQVTDSFHSPIELQGLSCRWEPLKTQEGTILTLTAQIHPSQQAREQQILNELLADLERKLNKPLGQFNPVKPQNLKQYVINKGQLKEFKFFLSSGINKIVAFPIFAFWMLFAWIMMTFKGRVPKWDAKEYVESLPKHADFRKYDDTLRMVLDVSLKEAEIIEKTLQDYSDRGLIYYGTAKSNDALMTCMVFSTANKQHLHFIDGGQGGYTLAAKSLKSKKLS